MNWGKYYVERELGHNTLERIRAQHMKLGGEGKIRAESGKRKLGLWFDDRRRSREIVVPFVGEGEVGKKKVRQWKTTKENLWQSWKVSFLLCFLSSC